MDELDLLKKHWKKDDDLPKISKNEIQKIIHKKSSSIVKWIFIISLIELFVGFILSILVNLEDKTAHELIEKNSLLRYIDQFSYVLYFIILYFIYKFYKIYRKISVEDNTSKLIENIIETRKIVRYYMLFNVITFFVLGLTVSWFSLEEQIYNNGISQHHLSTIQFIIIYVIMFLIISFMTFIFWLIYRLIYGFFLRKLKRNYNELKKMEV